MIDCQDRQEMVEDEEMRELEAAPLCDSVNCHCTSPGAPLTKVATNAVNPGPCFPGSGPTELWQVG